MLLTVPARHPSPGESPAERQRRSFGERLCLAAASWQGLQCGAPLESEKIKTVRRIPEQRKGEKRRRVCCYLRWLRLYRNSFHNELHVSSGSSGRDPRGSAVRYIYEPLPLPPVSRIWAAVMQCFLESRSLHLKQFSEVLL